MKEDCYDGTLLQHASAVSFKPISGLQWCNVNLYCRMHETPAELVPSIVFNFPYGKPTISEWIQVEPYHVVETLLSDLFFSLTSSTYVWKCFAWESLTHQNIHTHHQHKRDDYTRTGYRTVWVLRTLWPKKVNYVAQIMFLFFAVRSELANRFIRACCWADFTLKMLMVSLHQVWKG